MTLPAAPREPGDIKVAYLGIKGLPSRGGAERVVEALASRASSFGIVPTVYCHRELRTSPDNGTGVSRIFVPSVRGKYLRPITFNLAAALHALVHGDYDLIHLHNVEASFVLPFLRLRYRVLVTGHGAAYQRAKWGFLARPLMRAMDYVCCRFATALTSVSAAHARQLSRFGRPVLSIPNGIAESSPGCQDTAVRRILRKHELEPGEFFLFVAGRIEPTKGAHLAVEAMRRTSSRLPLLVLGDDTQVPHYNRQLRRVAGPNVRFEPFLDEFGEVLALMGCARCLVFPSSYEAMSMVLLEAASVGLPIVCSDIPENRAVLGEHGVYFSLDNPGRLVDAINWVTEHPDRSRRLGRRLRERVRERHSADAMAAKYVDLYREIVDGNRSSDGPGVTSGGTGQARYDAR